MRSNLTDRLAKALSSALAVRILEKKLPGMIAKSVVEKLSARAARLHQDVILKANEEGIEKYTAKLIQRFNEMQTEVLRNMKKNPGKAYKAPPVNKDFDVDSWLINREAWYGTLVGDGQALTAAPLNIGGRLGADEVGLGGYFDQTDPRAIEWLQANAKNAAFSITATQYEALRETLMTGIADGESIWTLRKRIEATLGIARNRAEGIARTEVLKASNRGSLISYQQSGVVEGKEWSATYDNRTCETCGEMDGATMPLDEPFFEKGEEHIFSNPGEAFEGTPTVGGVTVRFDYEEIQHPPLHVRCRCVLLAIFKLGMNKFTNLLSRQAKKYEPAISSSMKSAVSKAGATLDRFKYRLKTWDSTKRKLIKEMRGLHGTAKQAAEKIKDTVRYTTVHSKENFVASVKKMHAQLLKDGFTAKQEWIGNYYGRGGVYRGINIKYTDPKSGMAFEVQYHTPESLAIVDKNHPFYEILRAPTTTQKMKTLMEKKMMKNWEGFTAPEGAGDLFGGGAY